MNGLIIRNATSADIPFLVETIIEAEKGGSDKFSYHTIFGLSEDEAAESIGAMLAEEIDGCELSISSFMVAEAEGQPAAAVGAWIEGLEGISSTVLKGNLLNYVLPRACLERAIALNVIVRDLHLECVRDAIQVGLVYVAPKFRGRNLVARLIESHVERLMKIRPDLTEMYVQVMGNNLAAARTYEKLGFEVVMTKVSPHDQTTCYLPSNTRILMKKALSNQV
jgi:ribosomal protein S18 acetylase RimI-like enzyme